MNRIKYYPLVDIDQSSNEKTPMFAVEDEKMVREHHDFWLEEIGSDAYWLYSKKPIENDVAKSIRVRCPVCGKVMEPLGDPLDSHRLTLHYCKTCTERRHKENGNNI